MRRERRRDRSLFELRSAPVRDFAAQAEAVASACHAIAVRFYLGAKLVVFGMGGASTDAQHVAVKLVHPVIVDTGPRPGRADWGNPAA
jgi:D-sedoheptulose 7-phosphate isomerase